MAYVKDPDPLVLWRKLEGDEYHQFLIAHQDDTAILCKEADEYQDEEDCYPMVLPFLVRRLRALQELVDDDWPR